MTTADILRAFDRLEQKAWPPDGEEVSVNGDQWDGQMVMKASDVLKVARKLARRLTGATQP